jgi:hypothetical protein
MSQWERGIFEEPTDPIRGTIEPGTTKEVTILCASHRNSASKLITYEDFLYQVNLPDYSIFKLGRENGIRIEEIPYVVWPKINYYR